jgi:hypothetical protein
MKEVIRALQHQLAERLVFVKPKDLVVADLLYSFATLSESLLSLESRLELLALSDEYGFADQSRLKMTRNKYQWYLAAARFTRWTPRVLAVLFASVFLRFAYRRKWFFLSYKDYVAHRDGTSPKLG